MSDSGDDTRALVSLEQNIANLERSMSASHLGQMERTQGRTMQRQVKHSGITVLAMLKFTKPISFTKLHKTCKKLAISFP